MSLALTSTRFGTVEIDDDAVIDFPSGLIGLHGRRYALLARGGDSAFAWLQSLDDPDLALPVTRPWRFFPDYDIELSDREAERAGPPTGWPTARRRRCSSRCAPQPRSRTSPPTCVRRS